MSTAVTWLLIVLGAVLILVEILLGAATGFDFLLIGSAVLAGGVLGLLFHSPSVGLAAAGILSLLYVLLGRRRIRGRLRRPGIPSNVDALLGRTAEVVEEIAPHRPGRIRFEGEEWRALPESSGGESASAQPASLAAGTSVQVTRVDGVTVYVVPAGTRRP